MSQPFVHPWYAIRTRSNYEKITKSVLEAKGYEPYLPLYQVRKKWSDRVVESSVPLIPGYVFCPFDSDATVGILSTPGVASIVGFGEKLAPIPNEEIEAIKAMLDSGYSVKQWPYLREGQRVKIINGVLTGLHGILVKMKSWKIVVSVEILCRSVAVEIEPDYVSAI